MALTDKVCFDRILPEDLHRATAGRMMSLSIGPTRAAFQIAKLWPRGTVIRIRFLNGTAQQRAQVEQFAPEWTEHANLRFEFGNAANAQVRIAFNDDGAWSYIGTDALTIAANQPTMNFGWVDQGVILHEFGHMLGMIHEHQNPRGNSIVWNKQKVYEDLGGPPNFWPKATVDHNMFAKYDVSQINGSELDPASVMLYSFPATWTLNGFHTDPNETLSALDKAFARSVYPGNAGGGTGGGGVVTTELPVFEGPTEAEIGQPGEEDLYKFTARATSRYTVETDGPSDVVMTLFGPDGERIAQDDDSGTDRNARIVANLVPGDYTVQVRHYNSSSGTGRYTIRATRG